MRSCELRHALVKGQGLKPDEILLLFPRPHRSNATHHALPQFCAAPHERTHWEQLGQT